MQVYEYYLIKEILWAARKFASNYFIHAIYCHLTTPQKAKAVARFSNQRTPFATANVGIHSNSQSIHLLFI